MVSNVSGPDFICVGMPKAGTGWLFDQLQYHPEFWMTPLKSLHYLDQKTPKLKFALKRLERLERNRGSGPSYRRSLDGRDLEFLREAASLRGLRRDLEKYGALFRFKGELFSGEISALYYTLKKKTIAKVASHFPHLKVILLVRDPVSRAWSNISMAHREGRFDAALLNDTEQFRSWLRDSVAVKDKLATEVAKRWMKAAPHLQFRHFFFDEIERDAASARADILRFLGGDPGLSGPVQPGHNRKGSHAKLVLTRPIEEVLVSHLEEEIRGCAALFGGHAHSWMERYGLD